MTSDEIIDFFAPHASSIDVVTEWLVESGIAPERIGLSVNKQVRDSSKLFEDISTYSIKQWIQFDASVIEVDNLMVADYYIWEHASGVQDLSTEEYHVPSHIQEHIE